MEELSAGQASTLVRCVRPGVPHSGMILLALSAMRPAPQHAGPAGCGLRCCAVVLVCCAALAASAVEAAACEPAAGFSRLAMLQE